MIFLDNLFRYPRFFISSTVGLILVLLAPIFKVLKTLPNKELAFLIIFLFLGLLIYILKQMVYID